MDMVMLQGAITGLKSAADIALGISKLNTMTEVQGKAIELQQIILSAQSSALSAQSEQFSLIEKIRTLEKEIADVKAWETEKQRYQLVNAPWGTSVLYSLKESMSNGEPPHWICQPCYENGKRSILQAREGDAGYFKYVCYACKAEIYSPWRNAHGAEYAK